MVVSTDWFNAFHSFVAGFLLCWMHPPVHALPLYLYLPGSLNSITLCCTTRPSWRSCDAAGQRSQCGFKKQGEFTTAYMYSKRMALSYVAVTILRIRLVLDFGLIIAFPSTKLFEQHLITICSHLSTLLVLSCWGSSSWRFTDSSIAWTESFVSFTEFCADTCKRLIPFSRHAHALFENL